MRTDARGYLLVLGAASLWSTSGLFIRWTVASSGFTPLSLAFWRDLTTFLCLLASLAILRPRWLRVARRDLPWLVGLGAIGVGTFHVLWNLAILYIGYAAATVLLYSSPAFVALLAWLIWREPLTRWKVLAIVLTLAGCVLVAGPEEVVGIDLTASGLLVGLAAALAYGGFSLFGRQVAARYSPWTVLTYGFGFGTLTLLPLQFGRPGPWPASTETWVWFGGLVLVATMIPFGAYLAGLQQLPVSVASILAASEVVFGAFIGYAFFAERLMGWQFLGAALVVAGVTLIMTRRKG
ncbi:MAG: DMT family transporter [Anaerolineae bacterium]|nr:DMT family transporter [Anaerolineae bacterium]